MEPERHQEIIDYIYEHLNASCCNVRTGIASASCCNHVREDRDFSSYILISVSTRRFFNQHNFHQCREENQHAIREHGFQHRYSVNGWAGILGDHVIGPHIFPGHLTGETYSAFPDLTLLQLLEDLPLNIRRRMWYQHDGTPAHFSIAARQVLNDKYPNRFIGRGGPVPWPPRLPDLTPLDFFLWGHMKSLVYDTQVESEQSLIA